MEYFLETHISNVLVVTAFPVVWICLATECNVMATGEISSLMSDHLVDQDEHDPLQHIAHIPCNELSPPNQSCEETDVSRTRLALIS